MLRILTVLFFVIIISFPSVTFSQDKPDAASQVAECRRAFQEVARQVSVVFSIYKKALLAQEVIITSADELAFRKQVTLKAMDSILDMLPNPEQCAK